MPPPRILTAKEFGLSVKIIDNKTAEAKLGDDEYIPINDFYQKTNDAHLKKFIDDIIRPLVTSYDPY